MSLNLDDRPIGAPDFEMPIANKGEQDNESLGDIENRAGNNAPSSDGAGDLYHPPGGGGSNAGNSIMGNIKARAKGLVATLSSKKGATATISTLIITSAMSIFGLTSLPGANSGTEQAIDTGDMSHKPMRLRAPRVAKIMTSGNSGDAPDGSLQKKISTPTKKLLRSYKSAGIIPMNGDTPFSDADLAGRGALETNPTSYDIDGRRIDPADLSDFTNKKGNLKLRYRLFGSGGSMNMRYGAWSSKFMNGKLFRKFKLSQKGGNADGSDSTPEERQKKFRQKNKSTETVDSVKSKASSKFGKLQGRLGKGDTITNVAIGACMAVKLPRIATSVVAAAQLMQLMPFATDQFLSPAHKNKASLVSNISTEDVEGYASPLTDVYEDEITGKKGSALDSKYLLLALGLINTKLPVSKYAPGYSMMKNPVVQSAKAMEDSPLYNGCDALLSPAGLNSAMALGYVFTGLAGPVPLLLSVSMDVAMELLMPRIIETALGMVIENSDVIIEALGNEELLNAVGIPFGDAIGTALPVFFSLASLIRYGAASRTDGIQSASRIIEAQNEEDKQMDIASLSPFDTSSKWTFLGSIVHNINTSMIVSGQYKNPALSIIPTIISQASTILSPRAKASPEDVMRSQYSHGEECGMGDLAVTVGCTPVALPIPEYVTMGVKEAIEITETAGFINTGVIPKDFSPDELLNSGFIVKDTWLYEFMTTCSDVASAEYLFNSPGCTIDNDSLVAEAEGAVATPSAKAAAMVVLQDIQTLNSLSGDDDPAYADEGSANSNTATGGITGEVDPNGWASPVEKITVTSPYGPRTNPISGISELHDGVDLGGGGAIFAVRDGTVTKVVTDGVGGGWGNNISIDHGEVAGLGHIYSFYAHLASVNVSVGDTVKAGQQIGVMGSTGFSTGIHLHFGIYKDPPGLSDKDGSRTYNPSQVVPQLGGG